jgi:hypothetical protein
MYLATTDRCGAHREAGAGDVSGYDARETHHGVLDTGGTPYFRALDRPRDAHA